MHERVFVLAPLAEVAPLAVHPVLQRTAKDLLAKLHNPARELAGQNAVVTGSTSGIGRAVALALADGGANVFVHGRRSPGAADQVVDECKRRNVQATSMLADLRDAAACTKLVESAWQRLGEIDIWINCAGADTLTGEAAKWPFERKLDELWAVDVRATMTLSRQVGAWMKQRGKGVILTMGWDQAETGMEGDSGQLFGAIKGAVMAFTKSLALELAPAVRVNCLAPGWIRTAWGEQASEAWQQRVLAETPLARWGTPEDVAAVARWLVSPAAAFITGQIIRINGGAVRL
jgi:3-oxoacyl-[acyl-carrier protein] reductase